MPACAFICVQDDLKAAGGSSPQFGTVADVGEGKFSGDRLSRLSRSPRDLYIGSSGQIVQPFFKV